MRSARVVGASHLSALPDSDAGSEPVVQVITDLPAGQPNAFYMDPADVDGVPIALPMINQPIDPAALNTNDLIAFDIFKLSMPPKREVLWKGRRVRQRGYSFDWTASPSGAGFG